MARKPVMKVGSVVLRGELVEEILTDVGEAVGDQPYADGIDHRSNERCTESDPKMSTRSVVLHADASV